MRNIRTTGRFSNTAGQQTSVRNTPKELLFLRLFNGFSGARRADDKPIDVSGIGIGQFRDFLAFEVKSRSRTPSLWMTLRDSRADSIVARENPPVTLG
jgi:hypothetical protein